MENEEEDQNGALYVELGRHWPSTGPVQAVLTLKQTTQPAIWLAQAMCRVVFPLGTLTAWVGHVHDRVSPDTHDSLDFRPQTCKPIKGDVFGPFIPSIKPPRINSKTINYH